MGAKKKNGAAPREFRTPHGQTFGEEPWIASVAPDPKAIAGFGLLRGLVGRATKSKAERVRCYTSISLERYFEFDVKDIGHVWMMPTVCVRVALFLLPLSADITYVRPGRKAVRKKLGELQKEIVAARRPAEPRDPRPDSWGPREEPPSMMPPCSIPHTFHEPCTEPPELCNLSSTQVPECPHPTAAPPECPQPTGVPPECGVLDPRAPGGDFTQPEDAGPDAPKGG